MGKNDLEGSIGAPLLSPTLLPLDKGTSPPLFIAHRDEACAVYKT